MTRPPPRTSPKRLFSSALSALDRFDRRRPFAPWLHRIAVNRAIDWSRARAVRHEVAASRALLESTAAEPAAGEALERGGEVEAALADLSPEHRALVILRYLLEYTPGEIVDDARPPPRHRQLAAAAGARSPLPAARGGIMREARLREALLDARVPDAAGAEERASRLVRAAYAASPPALRPRRRRGARRGLQAALAVGLLAVAISPAGAAVRDWVDDAVDSPREPELPALTSLPAPGALLVDSSRGPWIVREDGSRRLLGDYSQSAWSPRGLFVAATEPGQLLALDPLGEVRWTVSRPGPVADPAWSADGYRVAYLNGATLRVVAGDGTGDEGVARPVAPVAPAWRPDHDHVLAFAGPDGRLWAVDADDGARYFVTPPGPVPTRLAWSSDGSRLLVVEPGALRVLDRDGESLWTRPAPAGMEYRDATLVPGGDRVAAVLGSESAPGRGELQLLGPEGPPALLFAGPGRFGRVLPSPDGDWLLLAWRSADQWVFLDLDRPQRVVTVSDISAQFSPGTTSPPPFPELAGWCCPHPR